MRAKVVTCLTAVLEGTKSRAYGVGPKTILVTRWENPGITPTFPIPQSLSGLHLYFEFGGCTWMHRDAKICQEHQFAHFEGCIYFITVYIYIQIYLDIMYLLYILYCISKDCRVDFPMIPRQIESSNVIAEPPLHSGLGASGAPWRLKCLPGWWSSDPSNPVAQRCQKRHHKIWRPSDTLWGWKQTGNLATPPGRVSIDTWCCT